MTDCVFCDGFDVHDCAGGDYVTEVGGVGRVYPGKVDAAALRAMSCHGFFGDRVTHWVPMAKSKARVRCVLCGADVGSACDLAEHKRLEAAADSFKGFVTNPRGAFTFPVLTGVEHGQNDHCKSCDVIMSQCRCARSKPRNDSEFF